MTSLKLVYNVSTGKCPLITDELHKKYGKFVRTGPNTLSINSHTAVRPIYASSNAFDKSDAYRTPGRTPGMGIFFMRTKDVHKTRRKLWAAAFLRRALENYEPSVEKRTMQFVLCVESKKTADGVLNLSDLIKAFTHDIMGDVTFGPANRLEFMENGDPSNLMGAGQAASLMFEMFGEVPSLLDVLWYLPKPSDIEGIEIHSDRTMTRRSKEYHYREDLISHLLGEHADEPKVKMTLTDARLDVVFATQAGSDTVAAALTYMLFLLISHPEVYSRLQAELDTAFLDPEDPISISAINELPYLTAVLQESLRLGTPFPGLPRVTPGTGAVIDGTYIPDGVIVAVPGYSQQISEENFWPEPLAYKPERWLPGGLGPGSILNSSAIMTFSFGAFGCIGKPLALFQLRLATARIVRTFDLEFAPGFDLDQFIEGVQNLRTTLFTYTLQVISKRRL